MYLYAAQGLDDPSHGHKHRLNSDPLYAPIVSHRPLLVQSMTPPAQSPWPTQVDKEVPMQQQEENQGPEVTNLLKSPGCLVFFNQPFLLAVTQNHGKNI